MATIVNDRDVLLQAAGTRLLTVALPTNQTIPFDQVNGATKPSDNADVTVTAVNGGITVTGGGITLSAGGSIKGGQTAYATGTGFFLGYSSALYRLSIGSSTNYVRWDGSSMLLRGDILGTSSIDITGSANFGGSTSAVGSTYAVRANASGGSDSGILGYSASATGNGVYGDATTGVGVVGNATSGSGVSGVATTGRGVYGKAGTGGVAVKAEQIGSGTALQVIGTMTIDNSTLVTNLNAQKWDGLKHDAALATGASVATFSGVKPGAASTNSWLRLTDTNGTLFGYMPVWAT